MANASNTQNFLEYCTFESCETHSSQIWYNCYTCDLVLNEGVCKVCAEKCHRHHVLSESKLSFSFFCDCGAQKKNCKALQKDEDKPVVRSKICSVNIRNESFYQHRYHCDTCHIKGCQGICSECAENCHKNHNVVYVKFDRFVCTCRYNRNSSCKTTIKNESDLGTKLCTYIVTNKKHTMQHWFNCNTCNMIDNIGVCLVCAKTCHKGHDLVYSKCSVFFCDCGASPSSCKALVAAVLGGQSNKLSNTRNSITNYCSFERCETHSSQIWYNCYTCDLVLNEGVCKVCAEKCHRHHVLSESKLSFSFFCDCGAQKKNCKALQEDEDKPVVRSKICSVNIRNESFYQHRYHCDTCHIKGGRGICSECAENCHKNHNVVYVKFDRFVCICRYNRNSSCKTTIKNESDLGIKLCTYIVTNKKHTMQHWFNCNTCNMVDNIGVCLVCAKTCHKGHDLVYSKCSTFFCDCGASPSSCKALVPRPVSGTSIQRVSEPDADNTDKTSLKLAPDFKAMPHYKTAVEMGLEKHLVKHVLTMKWKETCDPKIDLTDLVDAVLSLQVEDEAVAIDEGHGVIEGAICKSPKEANEIMELRESKLCKICMDAELEILFLPCAHLIACRSCANQISECALCRKRISKKVKAFFS